MLNKGGNLIAGKQFTDLTKASALKDTNIIAVHDGNGLKKSSMGDVTMYMSDKFSNPNLLINPNFKINQRGESEYAYQASGATQYTVDRFRVVFLNVKTASDGLILNANGTNAEGGYLSQVLEYAVKGNTILSFKVSAVVGNIEFGNLNSEDNGNKLTISSDGVYTIKGTNTKKVIAHLLKGSSCKIEWIKLEQGSVATPFVTPNKAEELVKCKRYYAYIYGTLYGYLTGSVLYLNINEIKNMRTKPTIGEWSGPRYLYGGGHMFANSSDSNFTFRAFGNYGDMEVLVSNSILQEIQTSFNKQLISYCLISSSGIGLDAEIY